MKKDDVVSKVEISRGNGDPNYSKEYGAEQLAESRHLFRSALFRQSIREELVEDDSRSIQKSYIAAREHQGNDTPLDLSLETKVIEQSPTKLDKMPMAASVAQEGSYLGSVVGFFTGSKGGNSFRAEEKDARQQIADAYAGQDASRWEQKATNQSTTVF